MSFSSATLHVLQLSSCCKLGTSFLCLPLIPTNSCLTFLSRIIHFLLDHSSRIRMLSKMNQLTNNRVNQRNFRFINQSWFTFYYLLEGLGRWRIWDFLQERLSFITTFSCTSEQNKATCSRVSFFLPSFLSYWCRKKCYNTVSLTAVHRLLTVVHRHWHCQLSSTSVYPAEAPVSHQAVFSLWSGCHIHCVTGLVGSSILPLFLVPAVSQIPERFLLVSAFVLDRSFKHNLKIPWTCHIKDEQIVRACTRLPYPTSSTWFCVQHDCVRSSILMLSISKSYATQAQSK